jgi:hypothetical protein
VKTFFLAVTVAALAGCGISQDGGVECMTNPDCDVGLSCIATVAVGTSGVCAPTGKKVCTKQCVGDSDCLKSVPVCVTSCGGLKTCGVAKK